jgi:hypothetical protein
MPIAQTLNLKNYLKRRCTYNITIKTYQQQAKMYSLMITDVLHFQ